MAGYNYYSSPYNSPRAGSFRQTYDNAPMGQDFMFENQPYARPGPPGLLAEEGSGTATGYRPIEQINPNDRAFMSSEKLAMIASEEANRKRLGGGPDVKFMREGAHVTPSGYVDPTQRSQQWVDPTGPIAQSPHGLDALEQEGLIGNPTPSYLAQNRESVRYQPGFQNIITGGGSPQGLLGPGYAGQNRTEVEGLRQQLAQGGVPQQSGSPGSGGNDKSGWMGDERMRDSQNRDLGMAKLLLNFGNQQRTKDNDPWGGRPLTHY